MSSSSDWKCTKVATEPGYSICQRGSHCNGTFIRVYIPDAAAQPGHPLKAILYLHGFALCMPSFYEAHLIDLVKKGYIVFFPDFQRSCYPNTLPQDPTPQRISKARFKTWWSIARPPASESHKLMDDICSKVCEEHHVDGVDKALGPGLQESTAEELRGVAQSLLLIIVLLNIISLFRREYGKNLIHLLSTVGLSLLHSPAQWLEDAIALTEEAWESLSDREQYSHWDRKTLEKFAFGHSLGGLLALSVPFELKHKPNHWFVPKRIVVADPAASTDMGIPHFVICILRLFNVPFTKDPIRIQDTGKDLVEPVAILHGGADKLVPPRQWMSASGRESDNYKAIASKEKEIYFPIPTRQRSPHWSHFTIRR